MGNGNRPRYGLRVDAIVHTWRKRDFGRQGLLLGNGVGRSMSDIGALPTGAGPEASWQPPRPETNLETQLVRVSHAQV
jgi:hypothetical protein